MREVEKLLPGIMVIMERYGISFAYLLGSILIEEATPQDLDIAIYIKSPEKSILDYYNEVYFDLCDIFKMDNIDVVILKNVGFTFRYEVIKTGRLIYCSNHEVLRRFIEDALFYYEDIKPFKEEYSRQLHKRVKEGLLMAKRGLNKEKIDTFIDSINRSLDEIDFNLRDINDFTTFKETKQARELCVHYLRIALEGILDICRHIIAAKGFGIPDMERENLIDVLGMKNVIPPDFARKIRGMQGMRNAIVHVYWNLDYEKIYMMIKENLSDFGNFVRYIIEYVEKEEL
jgi:uncharacterized protein YutE (UPF0331/DUF86 family)/predicted nucleotidyltransferase